MKDILNRFLLEFNRYLAGWVQGWNRFWFTPSGPQTLAVIRILAGSLILYTHAVWSLELPTFFGSESVIPADYRSHLSDGPSYAWSHFDWMPGDGWLWPVHLAGLVVMFLFTIGLWTRVTAVLTAGLVISYANRATGALFGLDQINALLAIYLAISPCGTSFSVDRWWHSQRQGRGAVADSVMATIATRLIQLHMCVIYLFAGLGKLQGDSWWNGQAIWGAIANYEYQTLDLTFLADHMGVVNLLTWGTIAWETSYPFLVWPRLSRPVVIGAAVAVHLGIGMGMGMMTFGLAMIIGNMAFLPPGLWVPREPQRKKL